MSQNRSPEIEAIETELSAVYKNEYEYVEPYDGKKGRFPAEIYIETSTVNKIIETCRSLGITDDIMADNLGFRGGNIQLIFKTDDALKKFKDKLHEMYVNLVVTCKADHATFFKFNHKETGAFAGFFTPHPDLGYTFDDIAKTFDLPPDLDMEIGSGYQCIYLYANDNAALHQAAENIKSRLTKESRTHFSAWNFQVHERFNMLQIGDEALVDLQRAVFKHQPRHTV